MEMTPSLACANKCIFCWRNYSNPVTLKWKYEEDSPEWIVEEALRKHKVHSLLILLGNLYYKMVYEFLCIWKCPLIGYNSGNYYFIRRSSM